MFNSTLDNAMVPLLSNALFQGMLACLTCALLLGSIADRARFVPTIIFIFTWTTIVYDPIAYWTWNSRGWANKLGYLDYAGGTPVHICTGFGALAYCLMIGKRCDASADSNNKPHSTLFVVIGTFLLWAGWFGFNTGTSLAPTQRAVQALLNTQLAAAMGGFAWATLDYRIAKKWSVVGFCSGIISGLVAITPGAGFVPAWSALVFGLLGGVFANLATKLKFFVAIDDSLDVFAVHGIGAVVGNILTGLFASRTIAALDGSTDIPGGWLDRHYVQLGYQLACTVAAAVYTFVMTVIILFVLDKIPGLRLRISKEEEDQGIDLAEHDEFAFDYVELFPELPLSPAQLWNHPLNPEPERLRAGGATSNDAAYLKKTLAHAHSSSDNSFHDISMFPGSSSKPPRALPTSGIQQGLQSSHEIEGEQTYRRIHDELERSRWNEQTENAPALLDYIDSSSAEGVPFAEVTSDRPTTSHTPIRQDD